MQQTTTKESARAIPALDCPLRLKHAVHLGQGETIGVFVEPMFQLDDRPSFGPRQEDTLENDLGARLLGQIQRLAELCQTNQIEQRPLILPVPASVLETPSLINACLDTLSQTKLCPQELAFEFTDADMVRNTGYDFGLLRALRTRGLRISMDARQSWHCQLQPMSWLMIDTLRVPAHPIGLDETLEDMIAFAVDAGVSIIAEKPRWRDGDALARAGIEFGISPYADA